MLLNCNTYSNNSCSYMIIATKNINESFPRVYTFNTHLTNYILHVYHQIYTHMTSSQLLSQDTNTAYKTGVKRNNFTCVQTN